MNTISHISVPTQLATTVYDLLAILDDWLTDATDNICEDLTHFATTEADYHGDRWDLIADLAQARLALHRHLSDLERNRPHE